MSTVPAPAIRRVVTVHRGARDAYQVSAALAQAGLLDRLVTDLYWPGSRGAAGRLTTLLPAGVRQKLARQRSNPLLPAELVEQAWLSGAFSFLLEKCNRAPFEWRRRAIRATDAALGRRAGERARRHASFLLSYSYYGFDAFRAYGKPGALFQLHPHPLSVRRLLEQELADHPDCAPSLAKEWELALPESDFRRLVAETEMADRFLVASSFTRRTLIENGASPHAIRVIPYGVDSARFQPAAAPASLAGPLRLLFVGTINQRKGIKYLLEALRLLGPAAPVELTVCGRAVDDLALFRPFAKQVDVRLSVSSSELQAAYQAADLFVFPSVAEGFAQVLLEALASGLPILSTTHTAAPDLVVEGQEGFVLEPRRPDLLAARLEWALTHRQELARMRPAARARAEFFTWERFRAGVVEAVRAFLADDAAAVGTPNSARRGSKAVDHV